MKIKELMQEKQISAGDNVLFLLKELYEDYQRYLDVVEAKLGESAKMSKSKANVVDPEEAIERYGADTVRLYILFAAPPEQDFEWTDEGIQGAYRFLNRFWNFSQKVIPLVKDISYRREDFKELSQELADLRRRVHTYYSKYLQDMEKRYQFNTAIATIMEMLNLLQGFEPKDEEGLKVLKEAFELMTLMLSPIAPHICEEVWSQLDKERLIVEESFPEVDKEALKQDMIEIPVQVNGKLRAKVKVPSDADEAKVREIVLSEERLRRHLEGKSLRKLIYVKGKLVNLVVA